MRQNLRQSCLGLGMLALAATANAQSNAFTYQGRLEQNSAPATGEFNFIFELFDAESGGNRLGSPSVVNGVVVTNGLFTAAINAADEFGANGFEGSRRWLQMSVNDTPMSSRQEITAAPYALSLKPGATIQSGVYRAIIASPGQTSGIAGYGGTNGVYGSGLRGVYGVGTIGVIGVGSRGIVGTGTGTDGYGGYFQGRGYFEGNVGIGTLTPQARLDIGGTPGVDGIRFPDGTLQTTATTSGGGYWSANGTNLFYNAGNVSVGAGANTAVRLYSQGSSTVDTAWFKSDRGPNYSHVHFGPTGDWFIRSAADGGNVFIQDSPGSVGIGTTTPRAKLDVLGDVIGERDADELPATDDVAVLGKGHSHSFFGNNYHATGVKGTAEGGIGVWGHSQTGTGMYGFSPSWIGVKGETTTGTGVLGSSQTFDGVKGESSAAGHGGVVGVNHGGGYGVFGISESGGVGVFGTSQTFDGVKGESWAADHAGIVGVNHGNGYGVFGTSEGGGYSGYFVGRVRVGILEIAGADLAEKFPASEELKPGVVVAIDVANPGKMCLARGAYSRAVAGVVTGANNFSAGAILGNLPGDDKRAAIALTGRVYVYCDASGQAIEPTDLLTTSDTPGYAMKVCDYPRAQGAIIGKAMTPLARGEKGLVLVLVNLQ